MTEIAYINPPDPFNSFTMFGGIVSAQALSNYSKFCRNLLIFHFNIMKRGIVYFLNVAQ